MHPCNRINHIFFKKGRCSLLHTCYQILRFALHLLSSVEAIPTRIAWLAAKKQSLFQIQRHVLKLACELLVLYEKRFEKYIVISNHLHGLKEYAWYGRIFISRFSTCIGFLREKLTNYLTETIDNETIYVHLYSIYLCLVEDNLASI